MPSDRAGYTVSLFAIDVSPSMGEPGADPSRKKGKGKGKSKLDLAKEYVARKCDPKISSGRKTEAVGVLSFGGRTNNQANRAYVEQNPDEEEPLYAAVACDVAIQTAKPKTVEAVMNLQIGEEQGNPVSALMVALDMIHVHKHTNSWALEIILITDGESEFKQDEYEDAMQRLDDLGVKLSVLGMGFEPVGQTVDKSKSRPKRLSEKFWRTFVTMLHENMSKTTSSEEMLPELDVFETQLEDARMPKCSMVNSAVSPIDLYIGDPEIDPEQAIKIPIKYSKATMKARPPSLSKAWKAAMDLQSPLVARGNGQPVASQLMSSLAAQSQDRGGPSASDLAAMISADVKSHSTYVIKKTEPQKDAAGASQAPASQSQVDYGREGLEEYDTQRLDEVPEEEEEEVVAKEDIVKAWRFGSTWVPMEKDTFEPLETNKGVEVLGFFPQENIKRHHLMGEVRYIWPDTTSSAAQVKFSSLVEGMHLRGMAAVVRWVLKDRSEPVIGLCVPEFSYPGEDRRLDFMFWIQLPFAEDEHNFWFNSLTTYKTNTGKVITEHPLLPTDEQCELMDELVTALDLDSYAAEKAKEGADGDEPMEDEDTPTWFDPINSYNPVIHRIKEAILHAALTQDLDKDPLGPPHPELTKYFQTPTDLGERVESLTQDLKKKLDIKKVPARVRRQKQREGLREDEGFIDIDDLFEDEDGGVKAGKASQAVKGEPSSPTNGNAKEEPRSPAKPKKGRLISNENPLDDFTRLVEGEGDVFRKAIQDLGVVVKENVEASFSKQAFPLAIKCLKAMRETALTYEEVETYNDYIDDLEKTVKGAKFKHRDFWDHIEKAGNDVAKITPEEAKAALEQYD